MNRVFVWVVCILLFAACGGEADIDQRKADMERGVKIGLSASDLKKEKERLLETDRLFAKASEDRGFGGAFSLYSAEDARIFQNKLLPIVGKESIVKFLTENVKSQITWKPYFVEMSASGDLGYTLGKSQSTVVRADGKTTVSYGHYVTIWKKQGDGSWKLVFDSGIETPE